MDTGYVYTYPVYVNLTIAIDDELLERARAMAAKRGVSLQELLRGYLRSLVSDLDGHAAADELMQLLDVHGGRSGGHPFRRSDAYDGRL